MGGLGNQMFQYAAARSLSLQKKTRLYLDHSFLDRESTGHYTYRRYELNAFSIKANRAKSFQLFPFPFVKKYPSLRSFLPFIYFKEPHIEYTPMLFKEGRSIYLDGYWQCEKYFSPYEKQIREDFQFKSSLTGENKKISDQIINTNAVAVHIRRGDYITNNSINATHGTCSLAYYQQAIGVLQSKFQNLHFFFFSDDIEWAKQNFNSLKNSYFISNNKNENSFYDLQLMSLCNHFIIANSSFSWWGAWLGKHKDKVVIAPAKWFNTDEHNTKDLLPESWIKL
jgi:hypothetical protein